MRWVTAIVGMFWIGVGVTLAGEDKPAAKAASEQPAVEEGFVSLFDGRSLEGWQGDTDGYAAENGCLVCKKGGQLFTAKEYGNFIFRFEFKLEPGGNNGVAIRSPKGPNVNPAYVGMEIQIIDDDFYKDGKPFTLKDYQHHGSIYGVVPAKTGHLKPAGQWNSEEILCLGPLVKVRLNGVDIVDADVSKIDKPVDEKAHPGLTRPKGYIGFLGHGSRVELRNLRIKEMP